MPLKPRQLKKRRIAMCINAIGRSAQYLLEMRAEYDPNYPDYVKTLDSILALHDALVELLKRFREVV
jgi:hypothetical protein